MNHLPQDLLEQPPVRAALALLLGRYRCASLLGWSPWDFPVELQTFRTLGVPEPLLRRLVEVGPVNECPAPRGAFPGDGTGFVLTLQGAVLAETLLREVPERPRWDPQKRQLWYGTVLVKQLKRLAPDQQLVLEAFQQAGWPEAISNPLAGETDAERRGRLRHVVKRLNRRRASDVLWFELARGGRGLRWRALP
jgi:hypothetical protein